MIPPEYPAATHPARIRALGLEQPPLSFQVPALDILARLAGDPDADVIASAERSHRTVDQLLAPPRTVPNYVEAKSVILGLCAPHPDQDEQEREAAAVVYKQALSFFVALDRFLEARDDGKRLAMERRHGQVYAKCRELADRVDQLTQSHGYHSNLLLGLDDRRAKCAGEVEAINARRPNRYPSAQELESWQSELDDARTRLAVAVREHREGEEMVDQVAFELATAQHELAMLESEERELRQKIGG